MNNTIIKLNKEDAAVARDLILRVTLEGRATVNGNVEARVAEILVAGGAARVSKKKNYGRIAEITHVA